MQAHIVFGKTGVYDDHSEWMVCGYFDERKAKSRIKELNKLMKNLGKAISGSRGSTYSERKELEKQMKAHEKGDPLFSCDVGGVSYYINTVDIIDTDKATDRKDPIYALGCC